MILDHRDRKYLKGTKETPDLKVLKVTKVTPDRKVPKDLKLTPVREDLRVTTDHMV